ncbi:hypothetical protein EMPS_02316 [Entomortierella parvispora]|uniref:E2F/DP family winged-helix DNA-binding domain-containing protein n=1 Tax=Entomortierella parvispora TaxID=205924 RepID=A0A9P3LTK9_9FUNG|nr:hypothetical protein EMPS_02316 [Entomortierella parvispora]
MRPLAGHPSVPAGPPHASAAPQHHPAHHTQQEHSNQHQHQHPSQHHHLSTHSNQHPPQSHHHRHSSFTQYPSTATSPSSYDQLLSPPTSVSSVSAFSPSSSPLDYPTRSTYPPHIADTFPRSIQRLNHGPESFVHQLGHRATHSHSNQERYSYIPPLPRRPLLHRDPHYHDQAHDQAHAEEQQGLYRPQQPIEHHSPSWRLPVDQGSQGVQPPPPIRTQLSTSSNTRHSSSSSFDCPPLSGLTISSTSSRSGPSPATPRSLPRHLGGAVLSYPLMDSPVDYRERIKTPTSHHAMSATSYSWNHEDDMEMREREQGHYRAMDRNKTSMSASSSPASSRKPAKTDSVEKDGHDVCGGAEVSMAMSGDISISSSRKQSLTDSFNLEEDEDDLHLSQSSKKVKTSRKRAIPATSRRTSLGDVLDEIEEEANAATGNQSMTGHGLRIYAQRVCERVQATTDVVSVSRIVHELSGAKGELVEGAPEAPGQENIRRRVYDALNVLEALGVISMDENKDFRWVGIQESLVVNSISKTIAKRLAVAALTGVDEPSEEPEDEESEEPEDDDMEIEKLQREVDALKLGNELELAQLKDQAAKHVQVLNLVQRNKRRESKEQEKEERRRQRRAEKRAARAQAASSGGDQDMTDVGPQGCSDDHSEVRLRAGSEPRRRRRSSRQPSQTPIGRGEDMEGVTIMDTDTGDSEDAALRKEQEKRERKERRERKEKRALKRQQKEAQKLQLPFVMVQMEGYAGQSSDSEGGITVVRRVRDEQKARSSGKSKRHHPSEESTANIEISIPHQEEMSIISDTEVLTDLGLDSVPMEQLRAVFSAELIETVLPGVDIQSADQVSLHGGHERALNRSN